MTRGTPVTDPLSADEVELARTSWQKLMLLARAEGPLNMWFANADKDMAIELPPRAVRYLVTILDAMQSGRTVTITPLHTELTTQQAAELLGVSRPFLIQLLEKDTIPFRMVGTHRRLRSEDVIRYKESTDAERRKALDELTAEAQELDLGY